MATVFKKFIILLSALALSAWPLGALAAYDYGAGVAATALGYSPTSNNIYHFVTTTVGAVLSISAILFFGFMLYAGVRWMTTRGNEEFVKKAEDTLTAAVIGFIVITLSYALTRFVFGRIGL